MTTNSQLSTTELKQKQTKQTTRTGTESEMEITWKLNSEGGEGGEWREGKGNKKHNW